MQQLVPKLRWHKVIIWTAQNETKMIWMGVDDWVSLLYANNIDRMKESHQHELIRRNMTKQYRTTTSGILLKPKLS